jgi:hypothetical protein
VRGATAPRCRGGALCLLCPARSTHLTAGMALRGHPRDEATRRSARNLPDTARSMFPATQKRRKSGPLPDPYPRSGPLLQDAFACGRSRERRQGPPGRRARQGGQTGARGRHAQRPTGPLRIDRHRARPEHPAPSRSGGCGSRSVHSPRGADASRMSRTARPAEALLRGIARRVEPHRPILNARASMAVEAVVEVPYTRLSPEALRRLVEDTSSSRLCLRPSASAGQRSAERGRATASSEGRPVAFRKLRGEDLNLRPSGYEPDELPDCSTPRRPHCAHSAQKQSCISAGTGAVNFKRYG